METAPANSVQAPPASRTSTSKIATILICAALLATFGFTARLALTEKCAVGDELAHLGAAWAQAHGADFRCDIDHPALWKFYAAVGTNADNLKFDRSGPGWDAILHNLTAGGILFTNVFYHTPGNNPDAVLNAARNRMIMLGVTLGAVIAWWSWRLGGAVAAIVATAAFSFDPNFLAHSPIVKNDVPITLLFTAFMFAVWLLGERATVWRWLAASLLLGAALTTKYSGILEIPMLAIALTIRAMLPATWPVFGKNIQTRPAKFAAAVGLGLASLAVVYVFIWAVYLFRFSVGPNPNDKVDLDTILVNCAKSFSRTEHNAPANVTTEQLDPWIKEWKPNAAIRGLLWSLDHHVLPEPWLAGFLSTYGAAQSRNTFLCGQFSVTGWWYYFPAVMLFKTPLATLAALILCAGIGIRWLALKMPNRDWWPLCAFLITPVFYLAVAMRSHLNIGMRHVLPVYPFLFIFIGVTTAWAWRRKPAITAVLTIFLAFGLIAETFAAYPNYVPFFNVAFGGARGGLKLLSDSNLDWGQDLPLVKKWQDDHPDRTLLVFYWGPGDPKYYGIKYYEAVDATSIPKLQDVKSKNLVVAVSATALQGTYTQWAQDFWKPFRESEPLDVLGGSIYLYDMR